MQNLHSTALSDPYHRHANATTHCKQAQPQHQNLSYTNFGKVSASHTGRGLRESSARAAAEGICSPAAAAGKGRTGGEYAL